MKQERTFVGFGFGAIQAGLFVYEAWRSGRFGRIVVAEVVPEVVASLRANKGFYGLNVATQKGIEKHKVGPVEILNPAVPEDRARLVSAVSEADELATALPSVAFYSRGEPGDVASIVAEGLRQKARSRQLPAAVVYTAENHNHAAEILSETLVSRHAVVLDAARTQVLNTVIGKMSGVVTDARQIAEQDLMPMGDGGARAFLVEEFNRILITKIVLPGYGRGIDVFVEKPDLLPFEEAKLYGHNATHALLGYMLRERGRGYMSEATLDPDLLDWARRAFALESGEALCRKYAGLDPLFTADGYRAYVEDLMTRMTNPNLRDAVDRVTRDTRRKLGWDDRLIGTMRMALAMGIEPVLYARGAASALRVLALEVEADPEAVMETLWQTEGSELERRKVREILLTALG